MLQMKSWGSFLIIGLVILFLVFSGGFAFFYVGGGPPDNPYVECPTNETNATDNVTGNATTRRFLEAMADIGEESNLWGSHMESSQDSSQQLHQASSQSSLSSQLLRRKGGGGGGGEGDGDGDECCGVDCNYSNALPLLEAFWISWRFVLDPASHPDVSLVKVGDRGN